MPKPTISEIIPGATFTGGSLTIPATFLQGVGLASTVTDSSGSNILAALFFGLESRLKDKYLDPDYGVSCDGNFPSIGQKNDTKYYEVNSLTFSVFTPRNTVSIDPDNVV